METKAHITPTVLKWARDSIGYSADEISEKLNLKTVTTEAITAWEEGTEQPSYAQLKRLAHIYKRPLAIFFFPSPPKEDTLKQKFRSLPESYAQTLPPKIRYLVRVGIARQIDLYDLHEGALPDDIKNFRSAIENTNTQNAKVLAKKIREILKVSLNNQFEWRDEDDALKSWINKLEQNGLWIFKNAFRADEYCGFSLHDEKFPVIYLNNSMPKTRQIFSLFHELGHFLIAESGVDFRRNVESEFREKYRQEEVFCNSFAGSFLAPDDSLPSLNEYSDNQISRLAKKYKVSREVILRRYLDRGLVTQDLYENKTNEWNKSSKSSERESGGGGNYYETQKAYLGKKYLELLFKKYYQNKIDEYSLSEYLGVKVKSLQSIEDHLFKT